MVCCCTTQLLSPASVSQLLLPAMQCIWRKMQEQAIIAVRHLLTGKADEGLDDPAARATSVWRGVFFVVVVVRFCVLCVALYVMKRSPMWCQCTQARSMCTGLPGAQSLFPTRGDSGMAVSFSFAVQHQQASTSKRTPRGGIEQDTVADEEGALLTGAEIMEVSDVHKVSNMALRALMGQRKAVHYASWRRTLYSVSIFSLFCSLWHDVLRLSL